MTSRPESAVRRKPPRERRAELVAAACDIALRDGLESLSLRRVADAVGVFPGLVSHYFTSVDDLVAAAFAQAAAAELDQLLATANDSADLPIDRMRRLLDLLASADREDISLLWLDAWHAGRRRPALHAELNRQMLAWQRGLAALIERGVSTGAFRTDDPTAAAIRILAVVDGLTIQAAMRQPVDYGIVREMVFSTAERELGLRRGRLMSRARS